MTEETPTVLTILEQVKKYLRLESDDTDQDALLEGFISGAEDFIKNTTGKLFADDSAGKPESLYILAIQMLVAHWYDNRGAASEKNVSDLPYSLNAVIQHLSLSSSYE